MAVQLAEAVRCPRQLNGRVVLIVRSVKSSRRNFISTVEGPRGNFVTPMKGSRGNFVTPMKGSRGNFVAPMEGPGGNFVTTMKSTRGDLIATMKSTGRDFVTATEKSGRDKINREAVKLLGVIIRIFHFATSIFSALCIRLVDPGPLIDQPAVCFAFLLVAGFEKSR
jgi:hypothetical protein